MRILNQYWNQLHKKTPVIDKDVYARGVELFNTGQYKNALLSWEIPWKKTYGQKERFIRGLIQSAGALHHLQEDRMDSAVHLINSALDIFSHYPGNYEGLDMEKFSKHLNDLLMEIQLNKYSGKPKNWKSVKLEYQSGK